jgi:NDP-sugar pyrophosphorylase family protein
MLSVGGRPLLERIVVQLRDAGVRELFINLHHLPLAVTRHFGDGTPWGVTITYSHEPELLGTAGAAKKLAGQLTEPFIVYYGDNFVEIDLLEFVRAHRDRDSLGTLAVTARDETSASGVVEVDGTDRILRFVEKPRPGETASRLINAGVYVLDPGVLDVVPAGQVSDFALDVFPALLARGAVFYAFRLRGLVWGIDTPDALARLDAHMAGSGTALLTQAGDFVGEFGTRPTSTSRSQSDGTNAR